MPPTPNSYCFKILQLNIRGMNNIDKFDRIRDILTLYDGKIDVLVICETWVKAERTKLFNLPGYSSIFSCRPDALGGGLAVYIKESIEFDEVANEHCSGLHHIHLKFKVDSNPLHIHAVYRPPAYDFRLFLVKLESILSTTRSGASCAVIGDVNIPINLLANRISTEYLDLLKCYNYSVTNTYPTRPTSGNLLDHVTCSESIASNVTNATVFTDISDHIIVLSTFEFSKEIQKRTLVKTIVNHVRLNREYAVALRNIQEGSSLERLRRAMDMYIELKEKFSKNVTVNAKVKGNCPWMTFDLWILLRLKENALSRHRRRPSDSMRKEALDHISKKVQSEKDRAKKSYYNLLFSNRFPSNRFV